MNKQRPPHHNVVLRALPLLLNFTQTLHTLFRTLGSGLRSQVSAFNRIVIVTGNGNTSFLPRGRHFPVNLASSSNHNVVFGRTKIDRK
jgi:hypothetical protein